MRHTAEVYLWGTRIGVVSQGDDDPAAAFEYDADFRRSGIEPSPVVMPLSSRVYRFPSLSQESFHGLPGLLADTLPDKFGNAVIDAWLARQDRRPGDFTAIERLCYTGTRGMGALEYKPAFGPEAGEPEAVDVGRLVRLAADVLSSREESRSNASEAGLQDLLRFGTSAGGARAKAVVAWNENTGEIRSGQLSLGEGFGHWIMKFDGVSGNGDREGADPKGYTRVEYAYHLMARQAGIRMTECRLFAEGKRRHFMTLRFDREAGSGKKIHMQTLAGLAHWDFRMAGAYGYEQAARVALGLGLGQSDLDQLFRRMAFNVCAVNCDDHVKNISFLMDRSGTWRLSPAYDVTFAYNPHGAWTSSHQMSVNGKRRDIGRTDLLEAGRAMNIGQRRASEMLDDVRQAVSLWASYAEAAGVPETRTEAIASVFPKL